MSKFSCRCRYAQSLLLYDFGMLLLARADMISRSPCYVDDCWFGLIYAISFIGAAIWPGEIE